MYELPGVDGSGAEVVDNARLGDAAVWRGNH